MTYKQAVRWLDTLVYQDCGVSAEAAIDDARWQMATLTIYTENVDDGIRTTTEVLGKPATFGMTSEMDETAVALLAHEIARALCEYIG